MDQAMKGVKEADAGNERSFALGLGLTNECNLVSRL